jgi:hypothetical protein
MMIRYLKGEYVGESWDVQKSINEVTPFVCKTDIAHIKRVLTLGCPSCLVFDEAREKGNQHTFVMPTEITYMDMEDKYKNMVS